MIPANIWVTSTSILALILSTTSPVHPQTWDEDAITSSGIVQGFITYHNGAPVRTYLGVPFAKPPVGKLRFKKPSPVEYSPTPIIANKNPPGCIQHTIIPFPDGVDSSYLSEDCLFLNVWVPASASNSNRKTVMFWIYSGVFTRGSIGQDVYDARALASEGDVIVVTTNYRLGVLGFLTAGNPDDDDAPGNQAMYDILEALKWTNKNIEAFGGDSNKITIFGNSAGGVSVSMLCVSPLAKGLFQRAIMESEYTSNLQTTLNSVWVNLSQKIAKAVGCATDSETIKNSPNSVVSCMRDYDAKKLTRVFEAMNMPYRPMYGDSFLPRNPKEAIMSGDFTNVDVLCGTNRDEGSHTLTTTNPEVFGFFGEKDPKINKTYGKELMLKDLQKYQFKDKIVKHYLGNIDEYDYDEIRHQVYTSFGDVHNHCPTVYFAEKYAENGNKVYFYFFKHRPSNSYWAPWMGVVHLQEIQFVFGRPLRKPENYTCSEIRLSREMVQMWTDFAKYGLPTNNSFTWPLYSRSNPRYLAIDIKGKSTGIGPHRENCDFFRPYAGYQ